MTIQITFQTNISNNCTLRELNSETFRIFNVPFCAGITRNANMKTSWNVDPGSFSFERSSTHNSLRTPGCIHSMHQVRPTLINIPRLRSRTVSWQFAGQLPFIRSKFGSLVNLHSPAKRVQICRFRRGN